MAGGAAFTASIYPNPAIATATLRLTLARAATVRARVVDELGREVRSIPARDLAAGEHRIGLDVGGLSGGVYLVAVDVDGMPAGALRAVVAR
jgi:hypothetical protein